ncbi:MFS transporter, partial [Mycobacterium sp. ITM-2017-0098]
AAAPIAFSALMCVVALGVGFTVQHLCRNRVSGGRGGAILALGMVAAGMGLAGWAATVLTVGAALVAAAVLGAGYG